ncbi:cation-transporting P-type ATPase [Myxococcus sp. AM009]|uniref:cation-translocating P-type ATPase n=1 Tax=unclassified Myxococcus TaxID=2648731 RepID=UPI00159572C4|nr:MULTISPECIES: cation-transporting P-type ATPase [unclassified Myxococcus]NVI97867.1 cation-transporting P-type ATPase [Myxococcus sp. AM009]NVJ15447.1 cation-transporting P-type ATPase [Myxococcus sp. AM010]
MRIPVPIRRLPAPLDDARGLDMDEVSERRARYGRNDVLARPHRSWLHVLRETAGDPMLWFLVGTSGLYFVLGARTEGLVLLLAIVPLLGMDAFLHRRTRASTAGLRSRLAARATVLRAGHEQVVPADELVVGDLARVRAGEHFPADGVVLRGEGLQAEESSLTGEALPVRKRPLSRLPSGDEPAVEGSHWGLAGTRLLTGTAWVRIVFTGRETLYGSIVRSATQGAHARTPLQQAVAHLVAVLMGVAAVMCAVLAFVRWRQGFGWMDALLSAVTLAVAALPEEFPVAFTFFLGAGVYRLARRQALVRRSVSVENIGRVTCICSDKTGTLTEGRLRVTRVLPAPGVQADALLWTAALASREEGRDPLDAALLEEAARARPGVVRPSAQATFPFTEERRRETAVVDDVEGRLLAAVKGAPERVVDLCALEADARMDWARRVSALAADGRKVIACASQPLDSASWRGGEPDRGFQFLGLVAFEDPVRPGVREAVRECEEAGLRTVMVTGDHPATALAVARQLGLGGARPRVLTGEALEARLNEGVAVPDVDVVARAVPAQKYALVAALQRRGEVVAATGDGVNDVPALQAADVGIAMGERGTRSAREVASIVLLDDDFGTLVRAIAEGRQLFRNLQACFLYLLLIHIPLVVTAALVPLAGYPLLYLPVHIVWLELIIHPTAMLAFQAAARSGRLAPVRRRGAARFFSAGDWSLLALVGGLMTVGLVWSYDRSLGAGSDVEHGRAAAVASLTLASAVFAAVLTGLRTRTARWVCALTTGVSLLLIQVPALAHLLMLRPLDVDDWARVAAGVAVASLPLVLARWRGATKAHAPRAEAAAPPLHGQVRRGAA